jgi:hypothetical protein
MGTEWFLPPSADEASAASEPGVTTPVRKPVLKPKPTGKFIQRDFQREDLAFLGEISGGSANWSEMGSFKTSTCEWLIEQKTKHVRNPRVLVITTKTGKGPYLESLWEILRDWDVYVATVNKGYQFVVGSRVTPWSMGLPNPLYMRPVVVLAHYHCFTNSACQPQQVKEAIKLPNGKTVQRPVLLEDGTIKMTKPKVDLLSRHWDMIVVDEAHRMKNHEAQWTRNIKKLNAPYKHIMTGTGFVNNPAEIWSLLNFLWPDQFRSYWKFRDYFCSEEVGYSGYRKITGIDPQREDEFKALVRKVGVRRTMLECFPDIKEPIETVVYEGIAKELMALDAKGVPLHSPTVLSALNRLRQICVATPEVKSDTYDEIQERRIIEVELTEPSSKLDAAMEVIESLEWDSERKDQIVVFSNFRQPLVLLRERLKKAGIPYLHLQAEMNDKERYDLWHETWPLKEHQVFLCTLGVGSESINLSTAHRAVFLDRSWSPAQNAQAIGRIYRPGQTGACQLIYIQAEGTVDYRVLDTVTEKLGWFRQIFGTDNEADTDADN